MLTMVEFIFYKVELISEIYNFPVMTEIFSHANARLLDFGKPIDFSVLF